MRRREQVFATQGRACRVQLAGCTGYATEVDHIVPVALGGSNEYSNLRPACAHCNNRRASMARKRGPRAFLASSSIGPVRLAQFWDGPPMDTPDAFRILSPPKGTNAGG